MEIINVNTDYVNMGINESGLLYNRENISSSIGKIRKYNSKVTISVLAYNRIEKTIMCVESILKYTRDVDYDLILIDNGSTDGTLEYFKSVKFDKKQIIHITKNIGAAFPFNCINFYSIADYYINISNDLIVTENWLSNLLKVAESDCRIGMVCPMSSNVSNLQQITFDFKNIGEMQKKASMYNKSDCKKWHERLRLITVTALFSKSCLYAVGWPYNDVGFIHDFSDDDITFRIRRVGYKAVLAKDTWIHHNHDFFNGEGKNSKEFENSLDIGRKNFIEKYFGIDAWNDVNNFINEIIPNIVEPSDSNNCSILGIDVKCGTPILEIKNHLRSMSVFNPECCAVTSEGKYFIDLQTVCGADNVVSCTIDNTIRYFTRESFDYIIVGNCINEYPETYDIINMLYSLLKKDGQMFLYLKNTNDIFTLLNSFGYRHIKTKTYAYNITPESFIEDLGVMGISSTFVSAIMNDNVPNEYIDEINRRINFYSEDNSEEVVLRLMADKFVFSIIK